MGGWTPARRCDEDEFLPVCPVDARCSSAELVQLLDTVLVAHGGCDAGRSATSRSGRKCDERTSGGRATDENSRPRLPALCPQARSIAVPGGRTPACRGDVRRQPAV